MARSVAAIDGAEYGWRREAVHAGLEASGLDGLVVFHPTRVAYLTGLRPVPGGRPVALVLSEGYVCLVVPDLERDSTQALEGVDRVIVYPDHPGVRHPMEFVASALVEINANPARVASDEAAPPPTGGYAGPSLANLLGTAPADGRRLVDSLREVKSAAELDCIGAASEIAMLAHSHLHAYLAANGQPALAGADTALAVIGDLVGRGVWGGRSRGYGVEVNVTDKPAAGSLVCEIEAAVEGYRARVVRTHFSVTVTTELRLLQERMERLHSRALEVIRPGFSAASVDAAVRQRAEEMGCSEQVRHRAGQAVGLDLQESPYLDAEDTELEPGMVFVVESSLRGLPALVATADTVVVTRDGHALLTVAEGVLDSVATDPT